MTELTLEVAIAWPERALRIAVTVPEGACVGDAVEAAEQLSGPFREALAQLRAESDEALALGVFGVPRSTTAPVASGDRVEVYRPLQRDPREARRLLATKGLNVTQAG